MIVCKIPLTIPSGFIDKAGRHFDTVYKNESRFK